MDCQCPRVTRSASEVRYPCPCPEAANPGPGSPTPNPCPAERSGSGAKSAAKRERPGVSTTFTLQPCRPRTLILKALLLLTPSQPRNSRNTPESERYTSEVRVTSLKGGELHDVLEFHIYRDGQPLVTTEAAVNWLNEQLDQLEDQRGRAIFFL